MTHLLRFAAGNVLSYKHCHKQNKDLFYSKQSAGMVDSETMGIELLPAEKQ